MRTRDTTHKQTLEKQTPRAARNSARQHLATNQQTYAKTIKSSLRSDNHNLMLCQRSNEDDGRAQYLGYRTRRVNLTEYLKKQTAQHIKRRLRLCVGGRFRNANITHRPTKHAYKRHPWLAIATCDLEATLTNFPWRLWSPNCMRTLLQLFLCFWARVLSSFPTNVFRPIGFPLCIKK